MYNFRIESGLCKCRRNGLLPIEIPNVMDSHSVILSSFSARNNSESEIKYVCPSLLNKTYQHKIIKGRNNTEKLNILQRKDIIGYL